MNSSQPSGNMPDHRIDLFPEIAARIAQRRGQAAIYPHFVPARTAMVVVDMQNCWLEAGQPGYSPHCLPLVPRINALAQALRGAGGTVCWVQMNGSREVSAAWPRYRDFFAREEVFDAWSDALTPGNPGYELWHGLDVQPQDMRAAKSRYSAFIQGACDLHERLAGRGIDTVLIAGTATNVCCEASARDAQMLNYKVAILADGCATRSDAEHNASLSNLFGMFADVVTVAEAIGRLQPPDRTTADPRGGA
ncbi:Peroxyureidoacrylate/ureidoacrylate amidohydrolase RutB [Pigmentiphaga humi]|uniref:Peroxyureidoacrylate/ureidoacrylate amidohydrolase RutB n=1 Tax=Pigmentiphaga humi TaxID=2478468 RepID=A0A3P4AXV4_9BURK|nr:cysteine hydrolase [Pigmentiphaga humi]VCU68258.1 Peroxyureidoacrylate/ureidoacrylate amidohydrolase RutB [Pigmentiphaga humi]